MVKYKNRTIFAQKRFIGKPKGPHGPFGEQQKSDYILSMMSCANSLHFRSLAPSIRRSKS